MTPADIRNEILDILDDISPDEDLDSLDDEKPFREQLELDSMDFLDIVMELRKRHRIQIPEEDSELGQHAFDRHLPDADDERHRQSLGVTSQIRCKSDVSTLIRAWLFCHGDSAPHPSSGDAS